jgi:hypothetical protein
MMRGHRGILQSNSEACQLTSTSEDVFFKRVSSCAPCQDDGNDCTDDSCEGGVCVHAAKAPTGKKCHRFSPQLSFNTNVFQDVSERTPGNLPVPYDPEAVGYTIPGDYHNETTRVCFDGKDYRIELEAASHTAQSILQIPRSSECESIPVDADNYCNVVEGMIRLPADHFLSRSRTCWSRECILQHEKTHADEWRRIWEASMASLQQELEDLRVSASRNVCTEEQASYILKKMAKRKIEQALDRALKTWKEGGEGRRGKDSELKCASPKVFAICDQAKKHGWSPCGLCAAARR